MTYTVTYEGKAISLNDWYSSKHWSKRNKQKKEYREKLTWLIVQAKIKKFEQYNLVMRFRSRHDADNVITMCKFFNDALKAKGIIPDDTTKYMKSVSMVYDPSLKNNVFVFEIEVL